VVHKVGPALAAGNAVVLKPAEQTPLCSVALTQTLLDAGLPPGFLQLVCGPGETGGVMINDTSSYHADAMPYGGVKTAGTGWRGHGTPSRT
jgi:acyl-CoA reductase-like NAD-dependent aldehyde dehydrogenase